MRSFRVTTACRPALLAFSVGPWPGTWTAHIFENFKVRGWRSSTSRNYSRQNVKKPTNKRWVFIAGAPPTLTKLVKLCQFSWAAYISSGSSGRSSGGRRKDPSLLYGAGWEGGGENVPVAVWWDFENCNVPQGIEVYKVGVNIVSGLRLSGFKGPVSISAYGDTLQLSRSTQEALASTGIRLHHVPSGGKDSSDRALLVDLILWTFDHPPPAHLFLISGDRDFSNALHRLRMRNYNILLASPPGTTVSPALLGAATHVWQWNSLVRGDGLLQATPPHGGPRPYTPSYSPVSRGYDGNGRSSEVGMAVTQVQSRTGEGNSSLARKPDTIPASPSQSSQNQTVKDASQASVAPEEDVAENSNAKVLRQPRKKVLQQLRCLLMSHPDGMMLADLQNYIREGNLNFDKDFYGHGKVVPFLSSIPDIVQLERMWMEDNKSWSYKLFLSHEGPESRTEGSQTAESEGVQTPVCEQAGERNPAATVTSSQASSQTEMEWQNSTSEIKQEELDSPASSPLLRSVDQGQDKILSTDGLPQAGQSPAQIYEELADKDTQPNDFGKAHKEWYVQTDGLSSDSPSSVSDSNQKTSNSTEKETPLPTFLRSFVNALRNWQTKRTVLEDPHLSQQVHANLKEKDSGIDQADNYDTKSGLTEYSSLQSQLENSDTLSEPVRGEVEIDGLKEVAEAGIKEGSGGVPRDDASGVLSADNRLMSKGLYASSEVVANDGVSLRQVNNLESELPQGEGPESALSLVSLATEKDRIPIWKRWLFGPTSEEALSTSEVELKSSPQLKQVSQSDAVTSTPGCKEAEVDSELSEGSLTPLGEPNSTQPVSISPRTGTRADGDDILLWGHSFVIRRESKSDCTRSMKIWEELEEYVDGAEGTLLLSNASNLTVAVHLIKTEGPSRFQWLDSNQIAALVRPLAKAKGINWMLLDEPVSSVCSVAGPVGSLQGDAARNLFESKNAVDYESQAQGKDIRIGDGIESSIQKNKEIDETARDKPSLETGNHSVGQEAFHDQIGPSSTVSPTHLDRGDSPAVNSENTPGSWQQYSEASASRITYTRSINENKPMHPSFEEFEDWFLRVVNSAFKRSARIEKAGYDLSLVKPDFEKEFGVRLDPKLYGFSRVQDLVASIPSVRLSKPRISQCTIHLLQVDSEVSEHGNQYLDEQVEEPHRSVGTKLQYWPKIYHDCKTLVRALMLENPEGVPGSTLKPLFGSRFSYPLDHKRVGYQRMSDLLRLMPDVVSVSGNLLVPSEEFRRSLRKEKRAGKRVIKGVDLDADREYLREDELVSEPRSGRGENWSEIDKEANGSLSSGDISGELSEVGQVSTDQHSCGQTGLEKHSSRREVLEDLCLSSDDESDSAEVDSQADQFQSSDEDVLQRKVTRSEKETSGSTRSSQSSKDYDFSDEIDELLLEDNNVEEWLFENLPDINQEHEDSADPGSENMKVDLQSGLDGHLHDDWAPQLLKDEIQESTELPHEHTANSTGSVVNQDEKTHDIVGSCCGEGTSGTSVAAEEPENFDWNTSTSVSDGTAREEVVSFTTSVDEQRRGLNSKSSELMKILQKREEHSRSLEESPQVDKSRVDSAEGSVVTAIEGPSGRTNMSNSSPMDVDVFCYTPSAESAIQAEDSSHHSNASTILTDKIETQDFTAVENAEDISSKSGGYVEQRQEADNIGGSSSSEVATKKSIWGRLFK